MRKSSEFALLVISALWLFPAGTFSQDKDTDHGSVEFGVRFATGDVYGRPDLPFQPSLKTSQFNEYQDVRDGFYVRRFDVKFDNVLHSKEYFSLKSQSTLYRDQSYLATFGNYGKFKVQFRYDEIPHIYSNTTRTLFTQTTPGDWSYPALIRQQLQAAVPAGTSLQAIINTQVVPQSGFITPQIYRKGGTLSLGYNLTPRWSVNALFFRESEKGTRPIGLIMNSSPSASATSGFGVELPELINYFNNWVRAGVEYGRQSLVVQGAYVGSFFQDNTPQMSWDNPFRLTNEQITNPLTGRMASYPDNKANYLNFAAGTDLGKYLHVTASINPGWLRQDQAFLPYTTNTAINTCGTGTQACTSLAVLPEANLGGDVQTLAMNYNISTVTWKNLAAKVNYRYYDWSDNTNSTFLFTPVQGDASAPAAPDSHTPFGFTSKNLEVTGFWYFAKRSSLKAGYDALWMDRSNRDVAHSLENSFFFSGDWVPIRDLLIRLSYRHSNRTPDSYQDGNSTDPVSGADVTCADTTTVTFTADQRCHRRFDEAARILNRGDALVQYSPSDKLTVSAFGGTLQNNYNQRGGVNSPTPLNFLTGAAATTQLYYLYGLQKDISYNYGFDADYALSTHVTVYLEYSREHYYTRMITRYRAPPSGVQTILTCTGCDTPNNDWQSTTRDPVDYYSAGVDLYLGRKMYFTAYYSLSAGKGNVNSQFLGDPTILTGANAFQLTGTNAAAPYPETVNRSHEVGVIFKYKLTERLTPKVEYRYQQWDNRDYQTTVMTPYMGCVSPPPPGAPVPGCTNPILNSATSPTPVPGAASPFYPGFVVGDPSAARYLFLGVDQPSYHAHTVMATLEYRF
ncbi:MAG TPA: MtrB/PioB family outer membrane beta-barrel protein [Candidatus Sulfotelmatobacter sp.]|jgi:MtrB/PioB family decaheme-associated outer membrane protein|nr:MtrB/PioB family outer membrane beta-barrel protein [Candidatus Sulfotelmatobacter sp.]